MRLINADALIGALHNYAFLEGDDRSICYNVIQRQPTVDAVPVIRCEDCKYRYVDGENVRFNVCELNHNKVQPDDWYCGDAERRNNED